MKTEQMTNSQTMVKMTFDRWNTLTENFDAALRSLTDEQLQQEIAPGRNRGTYLVGHLIAVHDNMLPLLDMGEKKYPQLARPFIELPDKAAHELPSAQELRALWNEQKEDLRRKFSHLQPDEWLEKHTAVSEEDFAKEPHRNKLNIIVTRASHLSYHLGQFMLLK